MNNKYSTKTIQGTLEAFEIVHPEELGIHKSNLNWSIDEVGIRSEQKGAADRLDSFVYEITGEKNIRTAYAKLYEQWEFLKNNVQENITEAPQYEALTQSNMPDYGQRELNDDILKQRESAKKEADVKAKEFTQQEIEARQKIAEKNNIIQKQRDVVQKNIKVLEDTKIYAKVEVKESEIKLPENQQKIYNSLKEQVAANPDKFIEDTAQIIKERAFKNAPESISEVERNILSEQIAKEVAENLAVANVSTSQNQEYVQELIQYHPQIQIAVASKVNSSDILNNKPDVKTPFDELVNLTIQEKALSQKNIEFVRYAFGDEMANKILGHTINVDVSANPQSGYTQQNISYVAKYQEKQLDHQSEFLNSLVESGKELTVDEIKSQFYSKAAGWLESNVAKLPADHAISQIYNSKIVQLGLRSLGFGAPIQWVATSAFGEFAVSTGMSPALGFIGETFGISSFVGLSQATTTAVTTTAIEGALTTGSTIATGAISTGASTIAGAGVATGVTTTAITTGAATVGGAAAGTGTAIATSTAAGAVLGNIPGAIIGFIGGLIGGKAIGKVIEKYGPKIKKFFTENAGAFLITGGLMMALGNPVVRLLGAPVALIGGAGIAAGGSVLAIGTLASSLFGFFGIVGRAIVFEIGTSVLVTILVFPIIVTLILFIINSGAYVIPPSPLSAQLNQSNPYLSVTKTPNPSKLSSPGSVVYTITIKATKTNLTGIKVLSTKCSVNKKDKTKLNCPKENIPNIDPNMIISPSSPYTFEFTVDYDSRFKDASVYDSIEISANSPEENNITSSGSASICIGDCPKDCINTDDSSWSQNPNGKGNLDNAIGRLSSEHESFVNKVCEGGEAVNLCYTTNSPSPVGTNGPCNGAIYAIHHHRGANSCDISFNRCGIGDPQDALYLLTHEVTHHIQSINGDWERQYADSNAWREIRNKGFCSYSNTKGGDADALSESMAEGNALYVTPPKTWAGCITNYRNQYPQSYIFAKDVMFNE